MFYVEYSAVPPRGINTYGNNSKFCLAQVSRWERRQRTHLCLWLRGTLLQRTSWRFAQGFVWQEGDSQCCCEIVFTLCSPPKHVHFERWGIQGNRPDICYITQITQNFALMKQVCSLRSKVNCDIHFKNRLTESVKCETQVSILLWFWTRTGLPWSTWQRITGNRVAAGNFLCSCERK